MHKKSPKNKPIPTIKRQHITPEEALHFLESMRKLQEDVDEPSIPISLRVPANLLRALKMKAKIDQRKYQSLIIYYIRKGLREDERQ